MAKLIYAAIISLDGYVEDPDGNFDWAEPDAEVHTFINDLERPVGKRLAPLFVTLIAEIRADVCRRAALSGAAVDPALLMGLDEAA